MDIGGGAPDTDAGQLLLHISHDLRSSLRAIRVHAEWIAKEWRSGNATNLSQHLGVILEDTAKLELLADGLAGYSIASRIDPASFVPAPLEVLLRTVLTRLDGELKENGATVTYDPLPRARCDPDRIGQVFENLLRNAVRHRDTEPPRIHISSQRQGELWLFAVRDNGPGIEAMYLERIFRPFERLRGQQCAGPGLGLSICRQIVDRHGGTMWAESEPGAGSTFCFTLPAQLET